MAAGFELCYGGSIRGGEGPKDGYLCACFRCFVARILPGGKGGGWKEQNQPQTEVKRPAWSIARGFGTKIFV
jgi:hypothetical protein